MDYQLEYTFDEQRKRLNVTLSGEVDIFNSADLKARLTALTEEHDADLFLLCRRLEFIDSTALGALVGVMKVIKARGRAMHLVDVKPNLMKLFRITNLDTVFIMEEADNG